jgi:hypothetical protein
MDVNQNNLTAKINSYKANTLVKPLFSELDRKDIGDMKEENRKLESILSAVDNSKTCNPNNNQANLNGNYINTEINNKEEKPGLLSRISDKFNNPLVKYPLFITGLGVLASQVSCAVVVTPVEESHYISGIPYVEQPIDKPWCLPASGAMVFNYYDINVTMQQVAAKVINEDTGLGSTKKLREYAKELGFKAESSNLNLQWVKKVLQQDVPIIIVQDFSLIYTGLHARVVIGYDDKKQELITHDPLPVNGENYSISYSEAITLNTIEPPFFRSTVIYPKGVNLNLP